jgi:Ricin-type beta-trefoil lectin domain/Peptidase family M23
MQIKTHLILVLSNTIIKTKKIYFNSEVVASKSGKVVVSFDSSDPNDFGNRIVIKQDDGHYAIYGHLSSRSKVVNNVVARGENIGIQGQTGNGGFTDHVHFEVLNGSVATISGCGETGVFGGCYGYSTSSTYKIIPQFDECFFDRGGADENECKEGGVNVGYPAYNQSAGPGYYWTSINSTTPTAFNNFTGDIWSENNTNFRFDVNGSNPANGTKVHLWSSNGSIAQKWGFYTSTQEIKGLNNKCLDGGDPNDANNRWLRINDCNSGNNQKWFIDTIGRIHSVQKSSLCIDSASGNTNGSTLYLYACHHGSNQRWGGNLPMTAVQTFKPIYSASNYSYGMNLFGGGNANQTAVKMWTNSNAWNERFEYNSNSQEIRHESGKCIDAGDINNSNNRWLRIHECHGGNNQKWYADGSGRIHSVANGNLCVDSWSGNYSGSDLIMYGCNTTNDQKWSWNYLN